MQIGKHGKSREGTGWMKSIKSVIGLPSKVGLAGLPALRYSPLCERAGNGRPGDRRS
jgi:hypothetical protein